LPGLNVTTLLACTVTRSPVRGLRDPRLPPLDLKHAEVSQLDATLPDERLDEGVKRPLHQFLRAKLGKVDLLGDRPDNVFLGHGSDAPAAKPSLSAQRRRRGRKRGGNSPEAYGWQALKSTDGHRGSPAQKSLFPPDIDGTTGKLDRTGGFAW